MMEFTENTLKKLKDAVRSVQETAENPPDQTAAEETEGAAQVPVSTDQGQRSAP